MKLFNIRAKNWAVSCYVWRNPTRIAGWPQFKYSTNIQGWFYIRCISFVWSYYALRIDFTKINFLDEQRDIAHKKNVLKYGRQQALHRQ